MHHPNSGPTLPLSKLQRGNRSGVECRLMSLFIRKDVRHRGNLRLRWDCLHLCSIDDNHVIGHGYLHGIGQHNRLEQRHDIRVLRRGRLSNIPGPNGFRLGWLPALCFACLPAFWLRRKCRLHFRRVHAYSLQNSEYVPTAIAAHGNAGSVDFSTRSANYWSTLAAKGGCRGRLHHEPGHRLARRASRSWRSRDRARQSLSFRSAWRLLLRSSSAAPKLAGHRCIESRMLRFIHLTHAASAKAPEHTIGVFENDPFRQWVHNGYRTSRTIQPNLPA